MKRAIALTLFTMFAACRTPSEGALLDAGSRSSRNPAAQAGPRCNFVTGFPGESFEVAGTGNRLTTRYVTAPNAAPAEQQIASARTVDAATVTKRGTRQLRTPFKDIVQIDFRAHDCFDMSRGDATKVSFFCRAKSGGEALWLTNTARMRYALDLTLFKTNCNAH